MPDRRSHTPTLIFINIPAEMRRDPPLYFGLTPQNGQQQRYIFKSWRAEGLAAYEKESEENQPRAIPIPR